MEIDPSGWTVWADRERRSPAEQVALDEQLLEDVVYARRPSTLRAWRSSACVVCPLSYRQLWARVTDPTFAPPVFRSTGGGVVALDPGVMLCSLAWARPVERAPHIDEAYRLLASYIVESLRLQGVHAKIVEINLAMCKGRYDIAVGERKIAGLSQRRITRRVEGRRYTGILCHAFILIDPNLQDLCSRCNAVAHALGVAGTERSALTSLFELTGLRDLRLGSDAAAG